MDNVNDFHMYCLSNGSENLFKENSLTKFKCKLPKVISWNKNDQFKWYVSLEAVGFDSNFTNENYIDDVNIPGIIVVNHSIVRDTLQFNRTFNHKSYDLTDRHEVRKIEDDMGNIFTNGSFTFYYQKHKFYSIRDYFEYFCGLADIKNDFIITSNRESGVITIKSEYYKELNLLIHESISKNINVKYLPHYYRSSNNIVEVKKFVIAGQNYTSYFIADDHVIEVDIKNFTQVPIPKIVKVKSEFIRDQVYNSEHAKDLACFTPFQTDNKKFTFYEAERKNFMQLNNTILDILDFKLTDGLDQQLSIHEGIPTIIKLNFRQMDSRKKSFHIRLSSLPSAEFPNNTLSQFSVRLPKTYYFNRDWKVALSSILIPGKFGTFPLGGEIRFEYFEGNEKKVFHKDIPKRELNRDEIFEFFNSFFNFHQPKFGQVRVHMLENEFEPLLEFTFFRGGDFYLPEHVCKVIGYDGSDFVNGVKHFDTRFTLGKKTTQIKMAYTINTNYYRPNYIMSYTNIVEPTPINTELSNILKVFQVKNRKDETLYEFKHLEYHRLLNDEINVIHIDLRNHAGEIINFERTDTSQVIVNFLFTNYID